MDAEARAALLRLARAAIKASLSGESDETVKMPALSWADRTSRGAFVTLRRGGRLRGCIGTFHPLGPLPETVWEMAKAAARDPRFLNNPIELAELPKLHVEISVLSPLERTADPLSLTVGTHGIYIRTPRGAGCFLPEVATELGWDARQFLTHCCREKAMLSPDAWQRPDAEVFLFTVEKIEEPADGEAPATDPCGPAAAP